jgi:CSLREA domain-containing protein
MKSRFFNLFTFFALLVSLFGSAVTVTPAYAASILVNTAIDEDTNNASCSLREAIIAANTDAAYNGCSSGAGTDTITFAVDYTITLVGS